MVVEDPVSQQYVHPFTSCKKKEEARHPFQANCYDSRCYSSRRAGAINRPWLSLGGISLASKKLDFTMDHFAINIDNSGAFQMGCWSMGLLWVSETSNAWRLRSSEALDGDHNTSTDVHVVLL